MTVEFLAEQLHREYRAAFKALHSGRGTFMGVGRVVSKGTGCRSQHDHGWEHCHRKDYFLRRAQRWIDVQQVDAQVKTAFAVRTVKSSEEIA